jgi:phosphoribosyl-ATP pyrophosphohydrolase/phosphoribosyl-AMP cyclohydrolase
MNERSDALAGAYDPDTVRFGADGLVPAVVQDPADGRVLMVAYMDVEALTATLDTGDVHFHSRSRGRLWRKGETSGNVLRLVSLTIDCDGDALLVTADPTGPTCHRGTRSCFDPEGVVGAEGAPGVTSGAIARGTEPATQGFAWLETLWATIAERAANRPAGSYTTSVLEGGVDAAARKVTEEATEVLMAAKDDDAAQDRGIDRGVTRTALAGETADLLFHALVLLAERDLPPSAVIDTLRARHQR